MPTYEYKCTVCDDRFEIEQRISDDALTTLDGCPVANDKAHRLKKVFSSIGISFKGDGFYRNDARGGSKSKARASDGGDSSSTSSSSSDSSSSSTTSTSGSTDKPSSSGDKSSGSSDKSSSSSDKSSSSSDKGSGGKSATPAKTATSSSD